MEKSLQSFNSDQDLQLWSSRVQERRNSGKSVKEWCRENVIASGSFYYWQSKIFHLLAEKQQTSFAEIPVEIVAQSTSSNTNIASISTNEYKVDMFAGATTAQIAAILEGIKRC